MVDVAFGATARASIFAIVDPLGVVPFFSVLTDGMDPTKKQNIVSKACLTATVTLGGFAADPVDKLSVFAGILFSLVSASSCCTTRIASSGRSGEPGRGRSAA